MQVVYMYANRRHQVTSSHLQHRERAGSSGMWCRMLTHDDQACTNVIYRCWLRCHTTHSTARRNSNRHAHSCQQQTPQGVPGKAPTPRHVAASSTAAVQPAPWLLSPRLGPQQATPGSSVMTPRGSCGCCSCSCTRSGVAAGTASPCCYGLEHQCHQLVSTTSPAG
jgi:hypothetical protein